MTYKTIQEIKQAVEKNKDVLTIKLGSLVKASPSGLIRATPGNVNIVRDEVEKEGMKFFHFTKEPNQNTMVRVYKCNTAVSEIIEAVLNPDPANDGIIRHASLLEQVRILLCG